MATIPDDAEFGAMPLHVFQACIASGQKRLGVDGGPAALMDAGLEARLTAAGADVSAVTEIFEPDTGTAALTRLALSIGNSAAAGWRCLTLGGDHSLAFATLAGFLKAYPDLRVLYAAAQSGLATPQTSLTGSSRGMTLAAHVGLFDGARELGFSFLERTIEPGRIALIGQRDLPQAEIETARALGIAAYPADEVRARGMVQVLSEALMRIGADQGPPLYLSFDINTIDPALAPATSQPVPGGLTAEEAGMLADGLAATGRLAGADLAGVNPYAAADGRALGATAAIALDLASRLLANGAAPAPAKRAATGA